MSLFNTFYLIILYERLCFIKASVKAWCCAMYMEFPNPSPIFLTPANIPITKIASDDFLPDSFNNLHK